LNFQFEIFHKQNHNTIFGRRKDFKKEQIEIDLIHSFQEEMKWSEKEPYEVLLSGITIFYGFGCGVIIGNKMSLGLRFSLIPFGLFYLKSTSKENVKSSTSAIGIAVEEMIEETIFGLVVGLLLS
jgi:hypothetical protein